MNALLLRIFLLKTVASELSIIPNLGHPRFQFQGVVTGATLCVGVQITARLSRRWLHAFILCLQPACRWQCSIYANITF